MSKNLLENRHKIALSTDCVIFAPTTSGIQVLMVRRDKEPFQDMWALPGGFLKEDETLEDCAMRKLYQETGVNDVFLRQVYTFSEVERDPRGRVLTTVYYAVIKDIDLSHKISPHAQWCSTQELPAIAFDHAEVIRHCIAVMKKDILHNKIIFSLLPESFILTEVQKLAEILLEQPIDKRNFRRRFLCFPFIEETGEIIRGKQRPAKLYRFLEEKFESEDIRTVLF